MKEDENIVSMSGNPVYRYDADSEKDWQPPDGDSRIEEISDHIEGHVGKIESVFHEIISDQVHLDVYWVKPGPERPYHTFITSGMSDLPMTLPAGVDASPFMELSILLPADWQVSEEAFSNEQWYWPIRLLKFLARFPHKYSTWLGWAHTMPNGDPAEPYADNTQLNGVIVLPSLSLPSDFFTLKIDESKSIQFFTLWPLYKEEMDLKLRRGTDALLDKFEKHQIIDVVDINRRNAARKRFGLF